MEVWFPQSNMFTTLRTILDEDLGNQLFTLLVSDYLGEHKNVATEYQIFAFRRNTCLKLIREYKPNISPAFHSKKKITVSEIIQ